MSEWWTTNSVNNFTSGAFTFVPDMSLFQAPVAPVISAPVIQQPSAPVQTVISAPSQPSSSVPSSTTSSNQSSNPITAISSTISDLFKSSNVTNQPILEGGRVSDPLLGTDLKRSENGNESSDQGGNSFSSFFVNGYQNSSRFIVENPSVVYAPGVGLAGVGLVYGSLPLALSGATLIALGLAIQFSK